jgi:hypothetical protein
MDLHDRTGQRVATPPAVLLGAETSVLAAALAHLLARDEDLPARWRTGSFASAVEAARTVLGSVGSVLMLPASGRGAGDQPGFREAVARLARNPDDVAIAVRRLELAGRQGLPAWPELIRRGLPARPSDLDAMLWFG